MIGIRRELDNLQEIAQINTHKGEHRVFFTTIESDYDSYRKTTQGKINRIYPTFQTQSLHEEEFVWNLMFEINEERAIKKTVINPGKTHHSSTSNPFTSCLFNKLTILKGTKSPAFKAKALYPYLFK
ncbi:hypothetical protein X953_01500 [Virgibacillus sp. SK37]|nr:hypothetical protein X953_01500 [Virgibacillus sp. SK37]